MVLRVEAPRAAGAHVEHRPREHAVDAPLVVDLAGQGDEHLEAFVRLFVAERLVLHRMAAADVAEAHRRGGDLGVGHARRIVAVFVRVDTAGRIDLRMPGAVAVAVAAHDDVGVVDFRGTLAEDRRIDGAPDRTIGMRRQDRTDLGGVDGGVGRDRQRPAGGNRTANHEHQAGDHFPAHGNLRTPAGPLGRPRRASHPSKNMRHPASLGLLGGQSAAETRKDEFLPPPGHAEVALWREGQAQRDDRGGAARRRPVTLCSTSAEPAAAPVARPSSARELSSSSAPGHPGPVMAPAPPPSPPPLAPPSSEVLDASIHAVWLAFTRRCRRGPRRSRTRRWPRSRAGSIRRRAGERPATPTSSRPRCGWWARATPPARPGKPPACSTPAPCSAPPTRCGCRRSSRASMVRCARCRRPTRCRAAGRAHAPLLLVVDDDDALARELPIEAAVRGWRAKVIRHLAAPVDDEPAVIVLGPDCVGDTDTVGRQPAARRSSGRGGRHAGRRPDLRARTKRTASPRRARSASRSPRRRWSRRPPTAAAPLQGAPPPSWSWHRRRRRCGPRCTSGWTGLGTLVDVTHDHRRPVDRHRRRCARSCASSTSARPAAPALPHRAGHAPRMGRRAHSAWSSSPATAADAEPRRAPPTPASTTACRLAAVDAVLGRRRAQSPRARPRAAAGGRPRPGDPAGPAAGGGADRRPDGQHRAPLPPSAGVMVAEVDALRAIAAAARRRRRRTAGGAARPPARPRLPQRRRRRPRRARPLPDCRLRHEGRRRRAAHGRTARGLSRTVASKAPDRTPVQRRSAPASPSCAPTAPTPPIAASAPPKRRWPRRSGLAATASKPTSRPEAARVEWAADAISSTPTRRLPRWSNTRSKPAATAPAPSATGARRWNC